MGTRRGGTASWVASCRGTGRQNPSRLHGLPADAGRRAFPGAARIVLVQENLNTHRPASLCEAFPPAEVAAGCLAALGLLHAQTLELESGRDFPSVQPSLSLRLRTRPSSTGAAKRAVIVLKFMLHRVFTPRRRVGGRVVSAQVQSITPANNLKMKTQTIIRWGLPVLAALALAPVASALTINFSTHHSDDDGTVTSALLAGPNGVAAGLETWNLNNFNDGASQSSLLDSAGATTGVGVSFVDLGGPDDWGYNSALKLLWRSGRQFYNGPGNAGSFSITGLDVGGIYDLWIATSHIGSTTVGDWTTANANTTGPSVVLDNTGNESNGATWVQGVNYVFFDDVVVDGTGKITMTEHLTTLNGSRVGFNGFQLVSAVPEPSAALLAGFGLLGLLHRRRRA